MTTLAIENVSMIFGVPNGPSVTALRDVNYTIRDRDFTVALGASGCGKTTLLKLLAGFMHPSAGRILLDGAPVQGPSRDRGVVFQKHALLPWLNVIDNVAFGPQLRGMPKKPRYEIARRYLALVGLESFAQHDVYKLSGGMQQRVGLARALANEPAVLLMDEPLGALDAFTRENLQTLILDVWNETGKTIFFITHSVEEALFMGNRLLVMSPSPGRVVEVRDYDFCSRYIETRDARAIKSDPAFIDAREDVLSLIQGQHAEA